MTARLTEGTPADVPAEQRFEMKNYLSRGTIIGGVTVTYIGPNFQRHFGDTIEENVQARAVPHWTLEEWSLDRPLMDALAAPRQDSCLTSLIQILALGPSGPGLFNGESNVHYLVSPKDGSLWTPHWYVRGDRLGFGALPAGDPVGWEPGDRFFL